MDNAIHMKATGVRNERILENLRQLGQGSRPVWVRVPVIPGVNDTRENMLALRGFLADLPAVKRVELLAYHNLGAGKHANLGGEYAYKEMKAPPKERLEELEAVLAGAGYEVCC
jgi:pyruvate formate lyase activating enzyme